MAKYCVNNVSEFALDPYASHVLRSIIQCLAGFTLSTYLLKSRSSQSQAQSNLDLVKIETDESIFNTEDDEIQGILNLICKKIEEVEDFKEFGENEVSSGILQCLVLVLSKKSTKLCKKSAKFITNNMFNEVSKDVFENISLTRLMESLIEASGSDESMIKIYNHFYKNVFQNNIAELAAHPQANFSVQKLILHCPTKEIFEELYQQELDSLVESAFESNINSGVILAICQKCQKLNAKQAHFLVALMKTLQCSDNQDKQNKFLLYLSRYKRSTDYDETIAVNLHGALMIQEILKFNKPIKMASSILATDSDKLYKLLADPRGCHITDAFMESKFIGEKSRESLIKNLQENLVNLACSKHGSRSIDAIWNRGSPKLKEILAAKLAPNEAKLNSDRYGKFIALNLNLSVFKRARDQWTASFDKKKKAKELFSDFLGKEKISKKETKNLEKKEEAHDFMIEKNGDENLLKRNFEECQKKTEEKSMENAPKKKKKKKAAKSYLDDL